VTTWEIQVIDVTGLMPRTSTGTPATSKNTFTAGSGNYRTQAVRAQLSTQRVPVVTASAQRAAAAAAKAVGASSAGKMILQARISQPSGGYAVKKSKVFLFVSVGNVLGGGDSPAGVVRVWADEPPGTVDCNNIPPKSTSAEVRSLPYGYFTEVSITVKAPATLGSHTMKFFLDTCSTNSTYIAEATLEYEVKAVAQPNLVITDYVYTSPFFPAAGQEFKVAVRVENSDMATGPSTKPFRIQAYLDTPDGFEPKCGQTDYARSILSEPITKKLGVGKTHTYTFTATARDTPGDTNLVVFVDLDCEVEEDNDSGNWFRYSFKVMPSAARLPDLGVYLPGSLLTAVKAGKTFKLKFQVKNWGNGGLRWFWNHRHAGWVVGVVESLMV